MPAPDRSHALDHIVVVLFENRSLDNVLGHLYLGSADVSLAWCPGLGPDLRERVPEW
jgi:phospholipase C